MITTSKRRLFVLMCVGLFAWTWPEAQADVLVRSRDKVKRYSDTGDDMGSFVTPGAGGLSGIHDMALMPEGSDLLVLDYLNLRVLRYASPYSESIAPGTFLGVFADIAAANSSTPYGMAYGADGDLYITGDHILRFNGETGAHVGDYPRGMNWPVGIALGPDEAFYLADRHGRRVVRFVPEITTFEDFVQPDSGGLSGPTRLMFTSNNTLLVTSNYTDKTLSFDALTGGFIDVFADIAAGDLLELPNGDILLGPGPGNGSGVFRYDADGNFLGQFGDAAIRESLLYIPAQGATVPEPATLAIWSILSVFGYLALACRKRKQ